MPNESEIKIVEMMRRDVKTTVKKTASDVKGPGSSLFTYWDPHGDHPGGRWVAPDCPAVGILQKEEN